MAAAQLADYALHEVVHSLNDKKNQGSGTQQFYI